MMYSGSERLSCERLLQEDDSNGSDDYENDPSLVAPVPTEVSRKYICRKLDELLKTQDGEGSHAGLCLPPKGKSARQ